MKAHRRSILILPIFMVEFVFLASCRSGASNETKVLYRTKPWMEVAVTAWRIKPEFLKDLTIYSKRVNCDGDVKEPEFTHVIESALDRGLKNIVQFDEKDGVARASLPSGIWLIVMIADTRGESRIRILNNENNNEERNIDFRN